jgi:preprotein translocase subunit SecA
MRRFFQLLFRFMFRDAVPPVSLLGPIRRRQAELVLLSDEELKVVGRRLLSVVRVDDKGKSATGGSRADEGVRPTLVDSAVTEVDSAVTEVDSAGTEVDSEVTEIDSVRADISGLVEVFAVTAVVAARVIGLEMFDVQIQGALALANGKIAEMQTGEGKTLAAVPAVIWLAKSGGGVHVMTVNDYLARRDAQWMGGIYEFLGLSVGHIQQGMSIEERRHAYACDITYATANEVGFDHLRDGLALHPSEQVHRSFAAAVIDEADSILIDEARIPLVIAGGDANQEPLAYRVDRLTRGFRKSVHFTLDDYGRNIALTDSGIQAVENSFGCGNLFNEENLALLTAVQDSIHAHALLRRDVDYLVKDGAIESVDEFKERIAQDRRWPAGLNTAIEAKEGVTLKTQGRILGSITLQNLIALYPKVCGMTGTAATQAEEFRQV